jgi:uncharacterized protein involved in exopolysaccharide biosynthesis
VVPKGKVPEAGMEYIRRYRDVKYYETIYELIARQFEMAKLDEARQGAIIQVADVAVPADRKSFPHRAIVILVATLIAFVAAAVASLGRERWHSSLGSSEEQKKLAVLKALIQ